MSWMKVRLSQSRGRMSPGFSSARRPMMDQSVGSGLAMSRLLMFRREKSSDASAGTEALFVSISSSSPNSAASAPSATRPCLMSLARYLSTCA